MLTPAAERPSSSGKALAVTPSGVSTATCTCLALFPQHSQELGSGPQQPVAQPESAAGSGNTCPVPKLSSGAFVRGGAARDA